VALRDRRGPGCGAGLAACVVIAAIIATPPSRSAAQAGKYGGVVYVGNDEVVAQWGALDSGDELVFRNVRRNDIEIFRTTDPQTNLFRDRDVARGATYKYKVCAQILVGPNHTSSFNCGTWGDVTVGQIAGVLFWDTTWSDPEYTLAGTVTVPGGSRLTVRGAAVIGSGALESAGGEIRIEQATLRDLRVHMAGSDSAVTDSTLDGVWLWFERHALPSAEIAITGNVFSGLLATDSAVRWCGPGSVPDQPCNGHTGRVGFLTIGENAHATIANNRFGPYRYFDYPAEVVVGGAMTDAGDVVEHAAAEIRDNDFLVPYTIAVAPYATATITDNRFDGRDPAPSAHKQDTSALLLFGGSTTSAADNVVRGFDFGINVSGTGTVAQLTGNTVAGNVNGLRIYRGPHDAGGPQVEARHNCIAGNSGAGVYFYSSQGTVVQATENWWGSDSGPLYPVRNPEGQGDRIYHGIGQFSPANGVVVDQWRTSPNCAAEFVGDCDGDGQVTAADLAQGIQIALGTEDVGWCHSMDASNDGRVTVDELVTAAQSPTAATPE